MPGALSCPCKVPTPLSHGTEPGSGPVLSFPIGSANHLPSAQEVTGPFDLLFQLGQVGKGHSDGTGLVWVGVDGHLSLCLRLPDGPWMFLSIYVAFIFLVHLGKLTVALTD